MSTVPAAITGLLVTLCLAPPVLWVLRRHQILDVPNERSSHQLPTVRGGGLAVVVGATVALLLCPHVDGTVRAGVLFVALAMGTIGLVDDLRGLPPMPRLAAQTLVAGCSLLWLLAPLAGHLLHGHLLWMAAGSFVVILWVVGYVNAFNFMDGINGISVAQVAVAGGAWWLIGRKEHIPALAAAGLVVAAAGLGFLPFNLLRPVMFLGDVGSYFLGGWLAALAVVGIRSGLAPEAVLAPLAVYGADTLMTIVCRLLRHQTWYQAHREHAYQRLVQGGWTHAATAAFAASVMMACAGLGALSLTGSLAARVLGDLLIGATLAAYLLAPRLVRGKTSTTAQ